MNNPLENLPFNQKRSFVMAVTRNGCEIYIPVDSQDEAAAIKKRDELCGYLKREHLYESIA